MVLHDIQGNIVKLINIETKEMICLNHPGPFAVNLTKNAPTRWIFQGKPYDEELGLVYFGGRYYSPKLKQWITPDPKKQADDLYQYCLGDPLTYSDPDGLWSVAVPVLQFAWGAGMTVTAPAWGTAALAAGAGVAMGYAGYKGYQYWKEKNDVYKQPKPGISGKEGAKDVPSWARGKRPFKWESGKDFSKRLLDEQYGVGNYPKGPSSDFNKIKKWGDRNFE